jgi:hypothetical protein
MSEVSEKWNTSTLDIKEYKLPKSDTNVKFVTHDSSGNMYSGGEKRLYLKLQNEKTAKDI